jgi:lysyl-tRNA synthetase class 1
LPVQVICENCGRVGTTIATDWDGQTVRYECQPDLVKWARGCGHAGRLAPFGGRATLPWNLEWAAKWSHFGVTIEGCGKDLATAGGSRDRSDAISREVFEREPPVNVPYEFLTTGGRRMSTSRGEGAAAHEVAALLPPELLRFLFLRYPPRRALEFDPAGETLPALFDEFDRVAAAVGGRPVRGEPPRDADRILAASLPDPDADPLVEAARFRPSFRHLAVLVQVPGVDLVAVMTAEKGAPLDEVERRILDERARIAAEWVTTLAPERYRLEVHREALPREAAALSEAQRDYLAAVASVAAEDAPDRGDAWQELIYRVARARGLTSEEAFGAIYLVFLGRPNGPRAGWLLASLEDGFVVARLRDAALTPPTAVGGIA